MCPLLPGKGKSALGLDRPVPSTVSVSESFDRRHATMRARRSGCPSADASTTARSIRSVRRMVMSAAKRFPRRRFLALTAATGSAVVLAACGSGSSPSSAPANTAAPAATSAPAAPTATAAPAAAPTVAVAAPATPAPQAAAPTVAPRATGMKFNEAPTLADLVKAGKLPPVEQRLPDPADVMVVKPLNEIGQYGGTWNRAFTGPADFHAFDRCTYEAMLEWPADLKNPVQPGIAKSWEFSPDNLTLTLHLRKGMKWSDGQPFG